jgi:hypothetical protein
MDWLERTDDWKDKKADGLAVGLTGVDCLMAWLMGWLMDWPVDWLMNWLMNWLMDRLAWLEKYLVG